MPKKIALVTGGNRGIGLAVVKALVNQGDTIVWLGARHLELGEEAAHEFSQDVVKVIHLDVTHPPDVALTKEQIIAKEGRGIDILINNAGVLLQGDVLQGHEADVLISFNTHVMAAYHLIRAFVPDMIAQNYGRIVNVSSGWGSFGEGLGGPFAYSMSKAALNALTLILSRELPNNVKVNALSPGWVKTQMGGPNAPRTPEEAAQAVLWLTQLPEDGPSGQFFRDQKVIPW